VDRATMSKEDLIQFFVLRKEYSIHNATLPLGKAKLEVLVGV
jgi:hypothetical protein